MVWVFGGDRIGHGVEPQRRITVAWQVGDAREGVGTVLQCARLREERGEELGAPCGGRRRGDRGGAGEEERGRLRLFHWLESLWRGREACEAEAVAQQRRPHLLLLWRDAAVGSQHLFGVVDEVAAGAVRAEADGVESAARLRLVLGVPAEASQLVHAVGELALGAVLAGAAFLVGAAEFGLVAGGDVRRGRRGSGGQGGSDGGQGGVAEAEARRREQHFGGHFVASQAADVSLDHADRAVDSEGDVAERGAGQLTVPAPLLGGGHVEPPAGRVGHLGAAAAAVELGVGEGHGAQRMATLEAQDSLTVLLLRR